MRILDCKSPICSEIAAKAPKTIDYLCQDCTDHFEGVMHDLIDMGIRFEVDPTIVRGLDYYTRTVFEVEVLDAGVGAIGGGGRYDGLVELEGGKPTPGIGFAVGFERVALALATQGVDMEGAEPTCVYVACAAPEQRSAVFEATLTLRDAGLRVEADYQGRSLKSQFKQADKLNALVCVIIGADEVANNTYTLRDMNTHEQVSIAQADLVDEVIELMYGAEFEDDVEL